MTTDTNPTQLTTPEPELSLDQRRLVTAASRLASFEWVYGSDHEARHWANIALELQPTNETAQSVKRCLSDKAARLRESGKSAA